MDKISEKILKYCSKQSARDLYTPVSLFADDFNLTISELNSLCDDLVKRGYLSDFEYADEETKTGKAYLSYKGLSYFGIKTSSSFDTFKKSVVLPIIVTLLTQLLLFLSKPLLSQIQELLSRIL